MYFDLVDDWVDSRFRCEKLFQLDRVYKYKSQADNNAGKKDGWCDLHA